MAINSHAYGQLVTSSVLFTDPNNSDAPYDPTTVTLVVTEPNGTKTAYVNGADSEVVKDSTGNYHSDISGSSDGRWYAGWYGTGTGQAAAEDSWIIEGSNTIVLSGIHAKKVPGSRIVRVSSRVDSSEAEIDKNIRMKAGEQYAWLIDLSDTQLSAQDVIDGMSAPTVTGGESANLTISASEGTGWGVNPPGDGVLIYPVVASGALTTDEIFVNVTIAPEDGDVFKVQIPVEVFE
jgi:hypothetical protein